jgi:hypothetical protein
MALSYCLCLSQEIITEFELKAAADGDAASHSQRTAPSKVLEKTDAIPPNAERGFAQAGINKESIKPGDDKVCTSHVIPYIVR